MAIDLHDLKIIMSGGASNVTPANSYGGIISTQAAGVITSQTWTSLVNITGVVIKNAYGNATGAGSLLFTYGAGSTSTLQWKPPGQLSYSPAKTISANADYTIGTSVGYIVVTVTVASLATSNKTDAVTIGNNVQNLFPNVTSAQSLAGQVKYRGVYIKNTHSTDTATGVKVWVKTLTPAGDELYVQKHGTTGNGSTTGVLEAIANDATAPTGISFADPPPQSSGTAIVIGNLLAGECHGLWIRRTIPAMTTGTVLGNTGIISISVDV
jgi:hypothetical protein